MASVTAQLHLLLQLQTHLVNLSKQKSFTDPAVREVRKQLRTAAETILLTNILVSEEKSLESKLWHHCFHKPVQEFRQRIAEAQARGDKGRDLLLKLSKGFTAFVLDAVGFYKVLAAKLQIVYGDVGFKLSTRDRGAFAQQLANVKPAEEKADVRISVYRCLICLGDLTRYVIQLEPDQKKDWERADVFYCQAISIYPEGGNAYNQRAVLAAYAAHELDAVYGYIRSLSVAIPFTIARENLNQLFEQIRQRHQKLPERSASRTGPRSLRGCKLPELMRSVETRFLHLHGLLFTHIDFDSFTQAMRAASEDLGDLLSRDAVVKGPVGHGPHRSDLALLRLAALSLFHPENLPAADPSSQADVAKRAGLEHAAMDLIFLFTAQLCKAVSAAQFTMEKGIASSPVLPSISVLLQWLATNPEELRDKEANSIARTFLFKALGELMGSALASCEKLRMQPTIGGEKPSISAQQALSEDVEMRGYMPLRKAHQAIDFSAPLTLEASQAPRLLQVIALLQKIGHDLQSANSAATFSNPASHKAIQEFLARVRQASNPSALAELLDAALDGANEENIVYQPGTVGSPLFRSEERKPQPAAGGANQAPTADGVQQKPQTGLLFSTAEIPQTGRAETLLLDAPRQEHNEAVQDNQAVKTARQGLEDPLQHSILPEGEGVNDSFVAASSGRPHDAATPLLLPLAEEMPGEQLMRSSEGQGAEAQAPAFQGGALQLDQQTEAPQQQAIGASATEALQNVLGLPNGSRQLSQEQLSRESTRSGTPRMPAAGGALAAPPGFPLPSRPQSRLTERPSQPAEPNHSSKATDINAQRQAPALNPLGPLPGIQPPWSGMAEPVSGEFGNSHFPTAIWGPQPGLSSGENHAGFLPQAPLPSLLPSHMLGAHLLPSHPAQQGSIKASAMETGLSAPSSGMLLPSTPISSGVQDIWQGLGLPEVQNQQPGREGGPAANAQDPQQTLFARPWQQIEAPQMHSQQLWPSSGQGPGNGAQPSQLGTDFQALQRLLGSQREGEGVLADSHTLQRLIESQQLHRPQLGLNSLFQNSPAPAGSATAQQEFPQAIQQGRGEPSSLPLWGSFGAPAAEQGLFRREMPPPQAAAHETMPSRNNIFASLFGDTGGASDGAAHGTEQQSQVVEGQPPNGRIEAAGTSMDTSWLDAFEAQQQSLASTMPRGDTS